MLKAGARIHVLERYMNTGEGISRKDDTLPKRFVEEPLPGGPHKGQRISKEAMKYMLDDYYRIRGWDEQGRPKKETLKRLGLLKLHCFSP